MYIFQIEMSTNMITCFVFCVLFSQIQSAPRPRLHYPIPPDTYIQVNILFIVQQRRLYNRETTAKCLFISSFPSMQLKWLALFLIQGSQPIMIKWINFQPIWWNPYKGDRFFIVESLLVKQIIIIICRILLYFFI